MTSLAEKKGFIWFDGKMVNSEKANIHVLTHTLHYGLGVFEGVRAYETSKGTQIFRLNDHTLKEAYIRPMCFYGSGSLGLRADDLKVHTIVAAWEWPSTCRLKFLKKELK